MELEEKELLVLTLALEATIEKYGLWYDELGCQTLQSVGNNIISLYMSYANSSLFQFYLSKSFIEIFLSFGLSLGSKLLLSKEEKLFASILE